MRNGYVFFSSSRRAWAGLAAVCIISAVLASYLVFSLKSPHDSSIHADRATSPPEDLAQILDEAANRQNTKELEDAQARLAASPDALDLARKVLYRESHPRAKIEAIRALELKASPESVSLLREFASAKVVEADVWLQKNALAALLRMKSSEAKEAVSSQLELTESGKR
jgi:hypothetical protein